MLRKLTPDGHGFEPKPYQKLDEKVY